MAKPTSHVPALPHSVGTPDLFANAAASEPIAGECAQTFPPITVRIDHAKRMIGISRSKLYELISTGEIETVKLGRATLVLVDSLRSLVERRRRSASLHNE